MRLTRFYCDTIQAGTVELDQVQSSHLGRVLRLKSGQQVELFDGKGNIGRAVIVEIKRKTTVLEIGDIQTFHPRTAGRIVIAASIAKGHRFDWMIKKCTELGVDHIAGVVFDRTVKQAKGNCAMERYGKMAIDSVRQCGRVFLPKFTCARPLKTAIEQLTSEYPNANLIFGGLGESAGSIAELPGAKSDAIVFIGPEGGFTAKEEQLFAEHNVQPIRLTDTILRIETAAVAFASLLCIRRDQTS